MRLMTKDPYSTKKAWGLDSPRNAEVEMFERIAKSLRRVNRKLVKENRELKRENKELKVKYRDTIPAKNLFINKE